MASLLLVAFSFSFHDRPWCQSSAWAIPKASRTSDEPQLDSSCRYWQLSSSYFCCLYDGSVCRWLGLKAWTLTCGLNRENHMVARAFIALPACSGLQLCCLRFVSSIFALQSTRWRLTSMTWEYTQLRFVPKGKSWTGEIEELWLDEKQLISRRHPQQDVTLVGLMNELGQQGWELITYAQPFTGYHGGCYTFKRQT